jgi:hypothetical protein
VAILEKAFVLRSVEKRWGFTRLLTAFIFAACLSLNAVFAQQPSPTPTPRTGRSYTVNEGPKNPPPPGPQAPSPVTFSAVTALTKIDFKHNGSPTSLKYLLETTQP